MLGKDLQDCGPVKKLVCVEINAINGAKSGRPVSVRTPGELQRGEPRTTKLQEKSATSESPSNYSGTVLDDAKVSNWTYKGFSKAEHFSTLL